ncbi:MAG: hypothetical protein IJT30_04060 [Muribaculaceae bacterium]|nr:hypothetical protein [Muribaculaceae bacterium]
MPYKYDPRTGEFVETPEGKARQTGGSTRPSGGNSNSDEGCGCSTWFWIMVVICALARACS